MLKKKVNELTHIPRQSAIKGLLIFRDDEKVLGEGVMD